MLNRFTSLLALGLALSTVTQAQNGECAGAIPLGLGVTQFHTHGAQTSAPAWPCALGGADIWFTYTAGSANDIEIDLCGSSYDTAMEVFEGSCGALTSIACNDDFCNFQSAVTLSNVVPGTTYTIRVGGFNSAMGSGMVEVRQVVPPPPMNNCVTTLFAANNGGALGGAMYFDITVTQAVTFNGLMTNTSSTNPVGMTVYTAPGTAFGNQTNMAAWTQVARDDGLAVGEGHDRMTPIQFLSPFTLAPGTYGLALVGHNAITGHELDHDYTSAVGSHQFFTSGDGVIRLELGSATSVPFIGTVFQPRIWNGQICSGVATPWSNYCGPAPANSTGNSGVMGASGSAIVAANDLVLHATNLPPHATTYFLTSRTQGFVMNPGGSHGNLCLGGDIGRYVGPGQILNSGVAGAVSLALDNSMQPTPNGLIQVIAGETWNYQAWHRDIEMMGVATSNLTDGLSVMHE